MASPSTSVKKTLTRSNPKPDRRNVERGTSERRTPSTNNDITVHSSYQHSELFAKLKTIDESIPDNLTSYQYLSVLDELLYNAIYPLIEGTKFIEIFLSQVLAWQTINSKRKVVGVGRAAFSSYATMFFLLDDPRQKLKLLKKLKIDRAVLFEAIRRWMTLSESAIVVADADNLKNLKANLIKLAMLDEQASVRPGFHAFAIYGQVQYWYTNAEGWKGKILEKYTRLCLTTARRDYVQMKHTGKLDDMIQVYLMSAAKAIDKCDTDRGVLTTHIQNWLLSAKNIVRNSQSTGGTMSQTRIGTEMVSMMMENVSLDEIENSLADDGDDSQDRDLLVDQIRKVARHFDNSGVGRILLNIEEQLSAEDKQILRAHAVPTATPA
jgi:hypothetical protein